MRKILFHVALIALLVVGFGLIYITHVGIKSGTVTEINCNNEGVCRVFISNNPGWFDIPWDTAKTLEFGHCYDTDTWKEIQCPG
jgi:hypothetical protein